MPLVRRGVEKSQSTRVSEVQEEEEVEGDKGTREGGRESERGDLSCTAG